jgi:WD40 repeat protein
MGGFYGSIQVRTTDRAAVKAAAEAVATARKIRCLIGPEMNGWVGVYPEGSGQDGTVGQQLAERVGGYAIHLLVHDDDILAYWLWSDGQLLDRYHSSPGYFGEENRAGEEPLVGDPKQFAFVLDVAAQTKLAKLIDRDAKEVFEVERLRRLARLLGIENVLTSYEYFKEADGSPVKGRRLFIEIPADNKAAAKKAERAAAAKKIRDERKRLKSAGILLAHFNDAILVGGVQAVSGGFIRCPAPRYYDQPSSLQFCSAPWKAPALVGFDLPPKSNPFNVVTDWTGRRVAAGSDHAIRIWDWDGKNARHVTDVPTVQFASVFAISADGQLIAETRQSGANSNHEIVVHDIGTHRAVARIEIKGIQAVAFSPDGQAIVVAAEDLHWIDLSNTSDRRQFSLGDAVPTPIPTAAAKLRAATLAAAFVTKLGSAKRELASLNTMKIGGKLLTPEMIEQTTRLINSSLAQMEKRLLDLQEGRLPVVPPQRDVRVGSLGFSRDGRWLLCCTNKGLHVYETAAFSVEEVVVLRPIWTVKPPELTNSSEYTHVHAIVEEIDFPAVIFGGSGPHLMRLDLETGAVRSLVQVPGATFVTSLTMTPDGRYLGVGSRNDQAGSRKLDCYFQVWDYFRVRDNAAPFK